jgi:dCMP deaminase
MTRISRDDLFMEVAHTFAKRSTCGRGKVGCVIVQDRRIVATGYNGSPPGGKHCDDVGCDAVDVVEEIERQAVWAGWEARSRLAANAILDVIRRLGLEQTGCRRTIHAEANAIAWAARHGVSTEGATLYCTHGPCLPCAQLIASAGIVRVLYETPYRSASGVLLLDELHISAGILSMELSP